MSLEDKIQQSMFVNQKVISQCYSPISQSSTRYNYNFLLTVVVKFINFKCSPLSVFSATIWSVWFLYNLLCSMALTFGFSIWRELDLQFDYVCFPQCVFICMLNACSIELIRMLEFVMRSCSYCAMHSLELF